MRKAKGDFYSLDDAVSYGIRQSITLDDSEQWEVYVRLINGNYITSIDECTREEAVEAAFSLTKHLVVELDKPLAPSTHDTFVDMSLVVRLYVDARGNEFDVVAEDVVGESHVLLTASKEECDNNALELVQWVGHLRGGDEMSYPSTNGKGYT